MMKASMSVPSLCSRILFLSILLRRVVLSSFLWFDFSLMVATGDAGVGSGILGWALTTGECGLGIIQGSLGAGAAVICWASSIFTCSCQIRSQMS